MADGRAVAQRMARRYFKNAGDQRIFLRQMQDEANFQDETSPAGAQGYAQIMPATAKAWGVQNVHDPEQAYAAAAQHMAQYLHAYGGSWRDALTAYNAGPGAVGGKLPAETRNYIATILGSNPGATAGTTSSPASSPSQHVELGQKSVFDAAGFEQARKRSVLANLLSQQPGGTQNNPLFASGLLSMTPPNRQDFTSMQQTSKTVTDGGSPSDGSSHGGVAHFDGKPVAAWIKPLLDYARAKGWQGTVQSGVRTDAEQKRIYDSGVRPAAVPISEGGAGSNHERTGFLQGAVDVSDAAALDRILRAKRSRLQWAGAKDPVHFSVPRGGSY